MKYTIKHRHIGEPDQEPLEFAVEAYSEEAAIAEFWKCHWDLNARIVSVTPNKACSGLAETSAKLSGLAQPANH